MQILYLSIAVVAIIGAFLVGRSTRLASDDARQKEFEERLSALSDVRKEMCSQFTPNMVNMANDIAKEWFIPSDIQDRFGPVIVPMDLELVDIAIRRYAKLAEDKSRDIPESDRKILATASKAFNEIRFMLIGERKIL